MSYLVCFTDGFWFGEHFLSFFFNYMLQFHGYSFFWFWFALLTHCVGCWALEMQQAQSEIFLNMKYTLDFVDILQILKDRMNNSYIDSTLKWFLAILRLLLKIDFTCFFMWLLKFFKLYMWNVLWLTLYFWWTTFIYSTTLVPLTYTRVSLCVCVVYLFYWSITKWDLE